MNYATGGAEASDAESELDKDPIAPRVAGLYKVIPGASPGPTQTAAAAFFQSRSRVRVLERERGGGERAGTAAMDSVAVMETRMDGGRHAPPSSGWFVQERSTKPVKEDSATVGSGGGSVYVTKAAPVEDGAANKAVAEGKKRTKTMRVKQAYIDSLLEDYPFKPYPWEPEQLEKTEPNLKNREILRAAIAPAAAIVKAARDKDEAIVRQYLAQGYAEEEVEVSDDEA